MRQQRPPATFTILEALLAAIVLAFILYAGLSTDGTPLPGAPSDYPQSYNAGP